MNISLCLTILLSLFYLIVPISTSLSSISILYVGGPGEDNYTSIQQAIDNASNGNIIYVYNRIYYENIVIDKSLIITGENKETTIIDSNGSGNVVTIISNGVVFNGFTVQNGQEIDWIEGGTAYLASGIEIISNNTSIFNNKILNNTYGIKIEAGNNNMISSNNISKNGDGVKISGFNNSINNNTIAENNQDFTWAWGRASNNGIILNASLNARVFNNKISKNFGTGIYVSLLSSNNMIYHNDLIDNSQNAYDDSDNQWDNGGEGNYWSDYIGIDTDYDNIGETSYDIPGGENKDNYPLMSPYTGEKYEFVVDEDSLNFMLLISMIVAIVFLLPIAYICYRKQKKRNKN